MIHEAMILEYAGPDLALVTVGEAMRLALLLCDLREPARAVGHRDLEVAGAIGLGVVALAAKVLVVGGVMAIVEVFMAKLRLFRLPELLAGAFVLALLGVVSELVVR